MATNKSATRVNGRHGEYLYLEDQELCFRTAGSTQRMPLEVVSSCKVLNTEEARNEATSSDLVPYGAWTAETPSSGGKFVYLVVKGRASLWVMEIAKSQVPNAQSFAQKVRTITHSEEEDSLYVPGRVINTPLGALFTVASIGCVFLATFLVFSFQKPVLGLLVAIAGIVMYMNIK